LETGDLIFTQLGSDENIISAVTEGYRGARPDHMGVVLSTDIGIFVLEAFPPEVRLTHIDIFLRRSTYKNQKNSEPRYFVGRLRGQYRNLISSAMEYGLKQRDIPYDQLYLPDTTKLYCSELVVDMFKYANSGEDFFMETPMSFRDLETGVIHPQWIEHYRYFGLPVPDGEPGSSPGDISLDSRIKVYKINGPLVGLRNVWPEAAN